MKQIKQDKYTLAQSPSKEIANFGQEIRLDLKLEENLDKGNGSIHGLITDSMGFPLKGVLVKLMSRNYDPLIHTLTDNNGKYYFKDIPTNIDYNIFAIGKGFKLYQGNLFTLNNLENKEINFSLIKDDTMKLSVIVGDIIDSITNKPIGGAIVTLMKIENSNDIFKGMTYTNEYGQYTFREIPKGDYNISVNALGYNSSSGYISVTEDSQVLSLNIGITKNPMASKGTISGLITDSNNMPINRGEVILYKVNSDSSLSPISFTKTNENGIYLFAKVSKGNYLIKANKVEIITIEIDAKGTVSGIITDDNNMPIKEADVILCKIKDEGTDNEETIPVSYTKTDEFGAYLFKDVKEGHYSIKATKIIAVTVE